MRVDIKSRDKFNAIIQKMFNNNSIPFIKGCSINSKNIQDGDIFFPLKGSRFDGHNFIEEAVENGASLIIHNKKKWGLGLTQ